MWAILVSFIAVCIAIASFLYAIRSRNAVRAVLATWQSSAQGQSSLPSQVESLRACQAEMEETLKTLANRVKMQRVRTAVNHISEDQPTSVADLKDRLRQKAGLVAGRPAPHK